MEFAPACRVARPCRSGTAPRRAHRPHARRRLSSAGCGPAPGRIARSSRARRRPLRLPRRSARARPRHLMATRSKPAGRAGRPFPDDAARVLDGSLVRDRQPSRAYSCALSFGFYNELANCPGLDAIEIRVEAQARPVPGDSDGAVVRFDRGIDNVLAVGPVRAGYVAGQREAFQARDRDVCGAADAELVHAAAPDGYAARSAQVVDAPSFAQATQAADLDVDDAAAAQVERLARVVDRMDALVEADRRFELGLQPGVIDDVVVGERLLDHHQVEVIHRLQRLDMARIVERIGRIRVGHQQDIRPALANGAYVGEVPSRPDLHLDPTVALAKKALDLLQETFDGWLDPEADPGEDLTAGAAQGTGQRLVARAGVQVPARHFDA